MSHAGANAYAPMTRVRLAKLGHMILLAEEFALLQDSEKIRPEVRIVEPTQLCELPGAGDTTPIILIASDPKAAPADPRVSGCASRPAGLRELYGLIQSLTEHNPRATPGSRRSWMRAAATAIKRAPR